MATQADARRIALTLPDVSEGQTGSGFAVLVKGKLKGFAWQWMERVAPGRPRVGNPKVLAVRVAGPDAKAMLLAANEKKFFTEPHYNGFPAVLVRLSAVTKTELAGLLIDAWRCLAPKARVAEYDAARGVAATRAAPRRRL